MQASPPAWVASIPPIPSSIPHRGATSPRTSPTSGGVPSNVPSNILHGTPPMNWDHFATHPLACGQCFTPDRLWKSLKLRNKFRTNPSESMVHEHQADYLEPSECASSRLPGDPCWRPFPGPRGGSLGSANFGHKLTSQNFLRDILFSREIVPTLRAGAIFLQKVHP